MRPIDADEITATLEIAISMMKNTKSIIGVENLTVIDVEIKAYTDILKGIKEQPTIQPEPKEGHWIGKYPTTHICSECGWLIPDSKVKVFAYCPNCGAKMKGVQNG